MPPTLFPIAPLRRVARSPLNAWTGAVLLIALLIAAPIGVVLASVTADTGEVWAHLVATVLGRYVLNSLLLMGGVGMGVLLIGVSTAWLVAMCRFPGRRWLEWALLLPLAVPAYLLGYLYTDWLDYYGWVQTTLRALFGWTEVGDYWFPPIRSLGGAILMFSLASYPYVYLLSRVAFLEQSTVTLEASRSLGCHPWQSFQRVALPLARPAIMTGLALVLMETLNDFGTVQYFAVDTFTVGIYRTWFGMGERLAACQLAALLLLFIFVLIGLEQWSRQQAQYYQLSNRYQRPEPIDLSRRHQWLATGICVLPILLGFLIPASLLLQMALRRFTDSFGQQFWQLASHSLLVAGVTAGLAVGLALVLAYGVRLRPTPLIKLATRISAMGYAVPGSVIAVGVLVPMGNLDNAVDGWARSTLGLSTGLLLSGTIVALVYAYLVRFLAISLGSVESSLCRIKPNLDDAARSLGHTTPSTLRRVHIPLLRGGLLTAAILVFVDVMKELPATLIVRPFNFDTLAVQVYRLAADERLAEAAAPALAIVAVGVLPVILLSWQITQTRSSSPDRPSG